MRLCRKWAKLRRGSRCPQLFARRRLFNGVSSERIDPAAQAKRAQVAAMMAGYLKNLEMN